MITAHGPRVPVRSPCGRRSAGFRVAALLSVVAAGCLQPFDTDYAAVRGTSLNGVSAFVRLLRDTGHATTARQRLPATIDAGYRTVVLFDDSFTGLEPTAAEAIDRLLSGPGGHTVLLVLRDSDAAIAYLEAILGDGLDDDRRDEAERMLAGFEAALAAGTAVARGPTSPFPDALVPVDREPEAGPIRVRVRTASGRRRSIEAAWSLGRRLEAGPDARAIWTTGTEPLLVRCRRDDDEVFVLASAAPLVNGGLVDPGNRALAEELAGLLPTDGRTLVAGSPRSEPDDGGGGDGDEGEEPSPWRLLTVQPLPWVAIQALAAIGLFCWWRSPIFGRPRREDPARMQDFGHHVDALAGLLDGSSPAGAAFTAERLRQWGHEPPRSAGGRRGRRRPP